MNRCDFRAPEKRASDQLWCNYSQQFPPVRITLPAKKAISVALSSTGCIRFPELISNPFGVDETVSETVSSHRVLVWSLMARCQKCGYYNHCLSGVTIDIVPPGRSTIECSFQKRIQIIRSMENHGKMLYIYSTITTDSTSLLITHAGSK